MDNEKKVAVVASRTESRSLPVGWGDSELTRFLQLMESQAIASFAGLRTWFDALIRVDQLLTERAPTFFHEIDAARRISSNLFMRAFATYRAAVRLAVSGQIFEATVLMRSILESAVYGWVCAHSEEHRAAWQSRGESSDARERARRIFGWRGLMTILSRSDSGLADRVQLLYEQLIDFGAHPNVEGLALSSETKNVGEGKYEVSTIFAHGADAILLAVLDLLRCMHNVSKLLYLILKERLQILGLDRDLDAASAAVLELITDLEAANQKRGGGLK